MKTELYTCACGYACVASENQDLIVSHFYINVADGNTGEHVSKLEEHSPYLYSKEEESFSRGNFRHVM